MSNKQNDIIAENRREIEQLTKECLTCGRLKVSSPTPEGDEVCPNCGDREMMDYEGKKIK